MLGAYQTDRSVHYFAEGDIFTFGGKGFVSEIIKIFTFGVVSHIGIVVEYQGELALAESTTLSNVACLRCGKKHGGVQFANVQERIDSYDGKVWLNPLKTFLTPAQSKQLRNFLNSQIEKPYDETGAIESAGALAAEIQGAIHGENFSKEFCSELTAAALRSVGMFSTENASKWNPSRLIRHLRWAGTVHKPVRLK